MSIPGSGVVHYAGAFKAAKDPNLLKCLKLFIKYHSGGFVSAKKCKSLFSLTRLPNSVLAASWSVAMTDCTSPSKGMGPHNFVLALQMLHVAQKSGSEKPTLAQLKSAVGASDDSVYDFPKFLPPPKFYKSVSATAPAASTSSTARAKPIKQTKASKKSKAEPVEEEEEEDINYVSGGTGLKDRLKRSAHKVKAKVGKAQVTIDHVFGEWAARIQTTESFFLAIQNHTKNLLKAYKTSFKNAETLAKSLQELYVTESPIYQIIAVNLSVRQELLTKCYDLFENQTNENVFSLNKATLNEFSDLRKLLADRNRKRDDYDVARHNYKSLNHSTSPVDPGLIRQAKRKAIQFKAAYEESNDTAIDAMKILFKRRYEFMDPTVVNLIQSLSQFHTELIFQLGKLADVKHNLKMAAPGITSVEMKSAGPCDRTRLSASQGKRSSKSVDKSSSDSEIDLSDEDPLASAADEGFNKFDDNDLIFESDEEADIDDIELSD